MPSFARTLTIGQWFDAVKRTENLGCLNYDNDAETARKLLYNEAVSADGMRVTY